MEPDEHEDDPNESSVIRELRAQNKTLAKQVEELTERASVNENAAREAAFFKAGIDPASDDAKWFVKAYDGDLTVEAIQEAAPNLVNKAKTEPVSEGQPDDSAALGRIVEAGAGRPPTPATRLEDQIVEAERAGDFATSRLLKNRLVMESGR